MNTASLTHLEREISQLSRDEQLWLIERLAHRLRNGVATPETTFESDLAAMAADPEIQSELRATQAPN